MPPNSPYSQWKTFLVAILALAIFVITFFAFNNYIYKEKQGDGNNYEPYRGTLSGEYICLPRAVAEGHPNEECEPGLKTASGEYYVVDFNLMSQEKQGLKIGNLIEATGVITPIERISNDYWRQYHVKGIFSVTDSFKIIK